ncbi:MAG: polyphosphate kinase 2 [Flavobacteriales bacterium]|nr:polyphosphate kinase 2 [Flavobacteriales bacterium]
MTPPYLDSAIENRSDYINLQIELVRLQQHIRKSGQKVVVLFEGRDTAGKGGAIQRFVRFLNPRWYKVVALNVPSEYEKQQWYFQKYIQHLPGPGEMFFFDRSWYNRAVVEPVMGFCTQEQYLQFLKEVGPLEQMWVNAGITVVKFWFSIDYQEQSKRLQYRQDSPLEFWKLSVVDRAALENWEKYTQYKNKMFLETSTAHAPWVVIDGNDKEDARLEAMRYVLHILEYDKKGETKERIKPDPSILSVC